jgi:hypothetical protein
MPTHDLLLAQALDVCIAAERQARGSADLIIAKQPAWAHTELQRLVALAGSLDATASTAVMSQEVRVAARARLMERIGGAHGIEHIRPLPSVARVATLPSRNGYHVIRARRRSSWLWRGGTGGLVAVALALAATLTASANALPGEPLYSVKQASEELGLRLAPDDQSRALVLLWQADARLDETSRLLQQGRTEQVAQTTQRFDEVIDRAATSFVVTIAEARSEGATTSNVETRLTRQQQQLQDLLLTAPEPTRADLREALVTTERNRALVADSLPSSHPRGRTNASARSTDATPAPPTALEADPTAVPTVSQTTALPVEVRSARGNSTVVIALNIQPAEGPGEREPGEGALATTASQAGRGASTPSRRGRQADDNTPAEQAVVARTSEGSSDTDPGDRVQAIENKGPQTVDEVPQAAVVAHEGPGGTSAGADQRASRGSKVTQPARPATPTATVRPPAPVVPTVTTDTQASGDTATKTESVSRSDPESKGDRDGGSRSGGGAGSHGH